MRINTLKTGLIFVLALFLLSCNDVSPIGGNLGQGGSNANLRYAELPLSAQMFVNDSLITSNSSRFLVGAFQNENSGSQNASAYFQFLPQVFSPTIPSDAIFDSLVLVTELDYYYNVTTDVQRFEVFEIFSNLNDTADFPNNAPPPALEPGRIGFLEFGVQPNQIATIRTRIDDDLGERLLRDAVQNQGVFDSISTFTRQYKGLAILPQGNNEGIYGINRATDASVLALFYHVDGDTDSRNFSFGFNGQGYTNIDIDYNGTSLANAPEPYTPFLPNDDFLYLQAGTGLSLRFDLASYTAFFDTIPDFVINSATLELNSPESFSEISEVPIALEFYLTTDDNRFIGRLPNEPISSINPPLLITFDNTSAGGRLFFDSGRERWAGSLTAYLNALRENQVEFSEVMVYPEGYATSLNGFRILPENIKLAVYYTVPE